MCESACPSVCQRAAAPSPGKEPYGNILFAVDAVGASNVWAAGTGDSPLILRWNGTRWKTVFGADALPETDSSG